MTPPRPRTHRDGLSGSPSHPRGRAAKRRLAGVSDEPRLFVEAPHAGSKPPRASSRAQTLRARGKGPAEAARCRSPGRCAVPRARRPVPIAICEPGRTPGVPRAPPRAAALADGARLPALPGQQRHPSTSRPSAHGPTRDGPKCPPSCNLRRTERLGPARPDPSLQLDGVRDMLGVPPDSSNRRR